MYTTLEMGVSGQPPSSSYGLPAYFNPIVGREEETALVRHALLADEIRLLTLAGSPGIGKTRLALEAAEGIVPEFPDGVWFVDLAPIEDPASVPSALLDVLQVQGNTGLPPLERLRQRLHNRELLVVLDTFEHILPAAALVDDLLTTHPGLSVLVTSRQPLRLKWEHTMTVSPLAIPVVDRGQAVDPPVDLSSVQLFLQRARATRLDFSLTPENAQEIATICAQVEGVPLAIELAASWVDVLPPAAILEYLSDRLSLLHSRTLDVPTRQRSLRATLNWSYDLLNQPEQMLLRRLSVCTNDFSLEAAAAAAGDVGLDILDGLSGLVDKSLLQSDMTRSTEPRFRLHHSVHSYGLERLAEADEVEETRRRHAQHFLSLAENAKMPWRHVGYMFALRTLPPPDGEWRPKIGFASLDRDYPNLLAALNWARRAGEAGLELRLAHALAPYWGIRAHSGEATQWLEDALSRDPVADPVLRARVLNEAGLLMLQQREFVRATRLLQEAVALARTIGEPPLLGEALVNLATAQVGVSEAEIPAARSLLQEAGEIFDDAADSWGSVIARLHLAFIDLIGGHGAPAEALLITALDTLEELGDRRTLAIASGFLAHAIALQGDHRNARSHLERSLRLCRDLDEPRLTAAIVDLVAWLVREELPRRAATLMGASDVLRTNGFPRSSYEGYLHAQTLEHVRARLGEQSLALALQQGRGWSLETIADRSLSILGGEDGLGDGLEVEEEQKADQDLTDREREILRMMSEGLSNSEIATTIFVSAGTVKLDIRSMYRKLRTHNRAQTVAIAAERGLI